MRIPLSKYDEVLTLWKGKEAKWLRFTEIKNQLEKQGWYEKKVIRYLKKMVFLMLLEKRKKGIKGARSRYRTTDKAHEYSAFSFFDRIRSRSQEIGWFIEEKKSLLVYGIPPNSELSPLEKEILDQILKQAYEAFFNLYLLKKSIMAREKVGQPIDYDLIVNHLLQRAGEEFKRQLWNEMYDAETEDDISNLISLARKRGIEITRPDRFLEIEKNWMSTKLRVYSPMYQPWSNFEEACLAVLTMLSPDLIEEYALESYNYLKQIVGKLKDENIPLTEESLVIIARDFLKRERLSKKPYTRERILALRTWSWLRLNMKSEATEKLVKIIYYLWQKSKETTKERKETQLKAVKPEIHLMTEEESKKEIEQIIQESQKIRF